MSADDTLVAALARAQAVMPAISKNHTNPHFQSRYADIADVLAVVRPVLAKEGIAITQTTRITDAGCELVTCLLKGDDRLESAMPLQIDQKAQDLGSRLTYLRRYALCALVGVAAEDDDDGHAASQAPTRTRTATVRPTAREMDARPGKPLEDGSKPCSDAQRNFIADLADKQGWSPDERTLVFKKIAGIVADPMTSATAKALIPELKRIAKRELVVEWDAEGNPQVVTAVEAAIADGEEPF
jgi:hypothetical protein